MEERGVTRDQRRFLIETVEPTAGRHEGTIEHRGRVDRRRLTVVRNARTGVVITVRID